MDDVESLRSVLNEKLFMGVRPYTGNGLNELRLRIGKPLIILCRNASYSAEVTVDSADIQYVIEHAAKCSLHSHREEICKGYIDYNGLRIGLCGTAIHKEGSLYTFSDISSLNIRVPSEVKGIFDLNTAKIIPPKNTIIISPPGYGKTTALRELIRVVSDKGCRVAVVDERNEIAAKNGAYTNFDIGINTDVLTDVAKTEAVSLLLRSMNPEIIAVDELSGQKDTDCLRSLRLNGVLVFATAHGSGKSDAIKKGLDFFERYIVIKKHDGVRKFEFYE